MKKLLILVIETSEEVDQLFHSLAINNFNGTILNAKSVKHIIETEDDDEVHFLNLGNIISKKDDLSTFCYFVVDENKIETLKDLIRENTNNFSLIKGAMFSYPIYDFEGNI